MKKFSLIILILLLLPVGNCFAKADTPAYISVQTGDLDFYYHPDSGIQLSVFGIKVINGSSMWVVEPGWVRHIYGVTRNSRLLETAVVEDFEGGKKITLTHSLPEEYDCPFEGVETYILKPDNTYKNTLKFRLKEDVPADIEWTVGSVMVDPIIGCEYVSLSGGEKTSGVIPVKAESPSVEESTVAKGFSVLKINSRLGPITIRTQESAGIIFFDYRKNRWADETKPKFWLGMLDRRIEYGKEYHFSVTLEFPEKSRLSDKSGASVEVEPRLKTVSDAQAPSWGQDYIIPTPKDLEYTGERFPLSSETRIYLGDSPGAEVENALVFLLKDLEDLFRIEPEVIRSAPPSGRLPKNSILLGELPRFPAPNRLCAEAGLTLPKGPEGYCLKVEEEVAYVAANTDTGLFYGITSLAQLTAVDKKGIHLKGAEIVDYPALDFRGVHCLSGKEAGDQIAKAIRTLMARFKMNSLVWECEYIIWDTAPELEHPEYGMTKEEARKVIEAGKKNFIELIPLVQSLGHSEWIFVNGHNLDIAEDPDTPYAYSPTHPRTYEFIFSVYQEALDFFQPEKFHIGHDEVTMRGRFPYRSKDTGMSVGELVLMDIEKLHDWFTERDVEVMMWGDMFLHTEEASDAAFAPSLEEAKWRRSQLPQDVIITDWHYAAEEPEGFTSIPLWVEAGFETIGAGWYNQNNIRNLARACVEAGAEGYLQTTWAGFNFAIDNNEEAWFQYWSYILAAEYAWSGVNTPVEELPFQVKDVFLNLWSERKPLLETKEGFFVDLRPVFNRFLEDTKAQPGWMGFGPDFDFSAFPVNQVLEGTTQFQTYTNAKGEGALLMAGLMNPRGQFPAEVTLEIDGREASSLHFLMNSGFRGSEEKKAGEIEVVFEDGSRDTMDLVYGKNLFAQTDNRIGMNARIAWTGQTRDGITIRAWDVVWENPTPAKEIQKVVLRSAGRESAPILFALTGVE